MAMVSNPLELSALQAGGRDLLGQVHDIDADSLISDAVVEIDAGGSKRRTLTDRAGRFSFLGLAPGTIEVTSWKLGYAPFDTTLVLSPGATSLSIALRVRPIALRPLTVRAERHQKGAAVERALFDREVMVGVVGISGQEIRAVPALGEADVLRSLQALPGVVQLNDLSAQLHVRGGGPDQNLFLLDGARVFAPYHLFGLFGAFNTDAVGRVEFFRGALPARYGGALSSVVEVEHRNGPVEHAEFDGGISLLAARIANRGPLPWANGYWHVAARRSHADLVLDKFSSTEFPYAFYDLQSGISLSPAPGHRVEGSFFSSADRFRMFLGGTTADLRSRWRNTVGSLRWNWTGQGPWSAAAAVWASGYGGEMEIGTGPETPSTNNRVSVGGLKFEVSHRGNASGFRAGVDVEGGNIALLGSEHPGSYYVGEINGGYLLPAMYGEIEHWVGPVRLAPGLRVLFDARTGDVLPEPRIGGRLHFSDDIAITFGVGRTHQILSTLRDDRNILPGAPFWFVHPEDAPASRTDGISAALEGWLGRAWSFSGGPYARSFKDVPRWRPTGSRDISHLEFDDGEAIGFELYLRRHAGRLTGWVGYGFGEASLVEAETGKDYDAPWDRRHAVDAALFLRVGSRLSLSSRLVYGGGMPFWPFVGYVSAPRLDPLLGRTSFDGMVPVWADEQFRFPAYARLDLGARYPFGLWGAEVEPYLNIQNVLGRRNVLYYDLVTDGRNQVERDPVLLPITPLSFTFLPSIGIDVRF
jgi:hypothetical protein